MPDIKKRKLSPGDEFLVLACDGIWECMNNETVVEYVSGKLAKMETGTKLSAVVENLLDDILAPDTSSNHSHYEFVFLFE